ncbi:MAG: 1-acyl-sn-glycerol-3-phosphate acyltransferase [Actinomycetota bacterium]|nr:1-acyl-sn-glycerol-3-phosphate acyltransferase [Actinomycetota bacterium]
MNRVDAVWVVGRLTLVPLVRALAPLRSYGTERVPREGGVVLAFNHFSWLDPLAFGATSPRTVYYMAKAEAHRVPGLGQLIRSFGAFAVRRGQSDREAVRLMRDVVRSGHALGLFVEGTRQRSGMLGDVQPGAAMVAVQEGVPVVPAAIHGSHAWRLGNFAPVTVAWGTPMLLDGYPRNGKGYRAASGEIGRELRRLSEFCVAIHQLGRPATAVPPVSGVPPSEVTSAAIGRAEPRVAASTEDR